MRAVTIALAAIPVVVGGVCLSVVFNGADPLDPMNSASDDTSAPPDADSRSGTDGSGSAGSWASGSWASESWASDTSTPTSSTGTPIDGRRPHLSVIDGRANAYLPVPLPEIASLLPTAAAELSPLPPTPLPRPESAGGGGGSDDRGNSGGDRSAGGNRNGARDEVPSTGREPKGNVPPAAGPAPAPAPGPGPESRPGAEPAPAPDPVKVPPLVGRPPTALPPLPTSPGMRPPMPGTEPPREIQDPRDGRDGDATGNDVSDESRSINAGGGGNDVVDLYAGGGAPGTAERDASGAEDPAGGVTPTDGTDDLAALATPEAQPGPVATDGLPDPVATGGGAEESDGSLPDSR